MTIPAAKEQEVHDTIKVMGGEDWKLWIEQLKAADVLADQAITVAYSYIGPEITYPIYKEGSIGQAKKHLYQTADELNEEVDGLWLRLYIINLCLYCCFASFRMCCGTHKTFYFRCYYHLLILRLSSIFISFWEVIFLWKWPPAFCVVKKA